MGHKRPGVAGRRTVHGGRNLSHGVGHGGAQTRGEGLQPVPAEHGRAFRAPEACGAHLLVPVGFYATVFYVSDKGALLFDPLQDHAESLLKALSGQAQRPRIIASAATVAKMKLLGTYGACYGFDTATPANAEMVAEHLFSYR